MDNVSYTNQNDQNIMYSMLRRHNNAFPNINPRKLEHVGIQSNTFKESIDMLKHMRTSHIPTTDLRDKSRWLTVMSHRNG